MNSIREALVGCENDAQINTVRLLFRTHITKEKIVLLVEGYDDVNVFEKFFNQQQIQFYPVCNCDEIIRIVEQIETRYQNRLLAIKDADFDRLKGISYTQYPNLFLTDYHDAEMLMLSGYGTVILAMLYNLDITKFPSFESLMKDIESISYLKLYNSIYDLRINFGKTDIAPFYTGKAPLDYFAYTTKLFSKSANIGKQVSDSTIINFACSRNYNVDGLLQLINGHDLFDVVYQVIRLSYRQNLKKKAVANQMRKIYTWYRFKETSLYDSLNKWFLSHGYINVWND